MKRKPQLAQTDPRFAIFRWVLKRGIGRDPGRIKRFELPNRNVDGRDSDKARGHHAISTPPSGVMSGVCILWPWQLPDSSLARSFIKGWVLFQSIVSTLEILNRQRLCSHRVKLLYKVGRSDEPAIRIYDYESANRRSTVGFNITLTQNDGPRELTRYRVCVAEHGQALPSQQDNAGAVWRPSAEFCSPAG